MPKLYSVIDRKLLCLALDTDRDPDSNRSIQIYIRPTQNVLDPVIRQDLGPSPHWQDFLTKLSLKIPYLLEAE
jgi:hypothetical protein